jgi:hypothetical protein
MKNLFKAVWMLFLLFTYVHANPCEHPAVASDDLNAKFRYGCFCGENYPNIEHPSKKTYKELNTTQRQELIEEYQKIDAYDDIDEVCKEHDICYIYHGREAKVCNDKIYNQLNTIEEQFSKASDTNITNEQCKNLAFDIGSVFNTIFSPSDDEDTFFDFGMLVVNGAITASNKVLQESADTMSDNAPRYPAINKKCLLKSLAKSSTSKAIPRTHIKVINIQRD